MTETSSCRPTRTSSGHRAGGGAEAGLSVSHRPEWEDGMTAADTNFTVETYRLADDGIVPNNPLPLVVYRGALKEDGDRAASCERMFDRNGCPGAWRNGIYGHHHYHSTAHEVLGIAAGTARVRLGGENGQSVELHTGDVVVIPAGVAHKRESASADLLVIGSYPRGQSPDHCRAERVA